MTDLLFDPPPAPNPAPKKGITINPKFAIGFAIAAFVLLIIVIAIPGDKTQNVTTTVAPVQTYAPAPVVNKYDTYLEHVYNNSGKANTMSKEQIIKFGDLVCQALDQGNGIGQVVSVVAGASSDTSDMEFGAAAVYAAVTYLCDEYKPALNAYLNN